MRKNHPRFVWNTNFRGELMGHQTIVHGYIEGSTFNSSEYRKLQELNIEVIDDLPEHDNYPFFCKSMFSIPGQKPSEGTYKSQIIHFGCSIKGLEFGDEVLWVKKFETLLKKMYWFSALVYIETEMDGEYKYSWNVSRDIISSYNSEEVFKSVKWEKEIRHGGKVVEKI